MYSGLVLAKAAMYSGRTNSDGVVVLKADKNGLFPLILLPIAGRMPNRNVISGTVAGRAKIEPETTYLLQVNEIEADPVYGRRFNFTALGVTRPTEIPALQKELGEPSLFEVGEQMDDEDTTVATKKVTKADEVGV